MAFSAVKSLKGLATFWGFVQCNTESKVRSILANISVRDATQARFTPVISPEHATAR
jgi:hypothetical protein